MAVPFFVVAEVITTIYWNTIELFLRENSELEDLCVH